MRLAEFQFAPEGDTATFRLSGELDMSTVPELVTLLEPGLEAGHQTIVLDFGEVTSMDSHGLRWLLRLAASLRRQRRALVVLRPKRAVRRLFELAGAGDALEICDEGPDL